MTSIKDFFSPEERRLKSRFEPNYLDSDRETKGWLDTTQPQYLDDEEPTQDWLKTSEPHYLETEHQAKSWLETAELNYLGKRRKKTVLEAARSDFMGPSDEPPGITQARRREETETIQITARFLLCALIGAASLELLDLGYRAYTGVRSWDILREVIYKRDFIAVFILQYGLGNLIPLFLLLYPGLTTRRAVISALLILFGVFMMRWNVVIGGQSFSQTYAGFMDYVLPIIPTDFLTLKEGLIGALFIVVSPFVILYVLSRIFPLTAAKAPTLGERR